MKLIRVTSQQSSYLAKVASGKTAQDIANEEHVSVPTVRYHLNGLRASFGAETLPELAAKGVHTKVIVADGQGGFKPSSD